MSERCEFGNTALYVGQCAFADCPMKLSLQKKLSVLLDCKGNLLGCSIGNILGIIVCSKWQSSPADGNSVVCNIIGNFSIGDEEFLRRESQLDLKAQGLLKMLPPLIFLKKRNIWITTTISTTISKCR